MARGEADVRLTGENVSESNQSHSSNPSSDEGKSFAGPCERLLTAKETAGLLNCHVSTVYELANRGQLKAMSLTGRGPGRKRGRKGLRILASSVAEFIAAGVSDWYTTVCAPPPCVPATSEPPSPPPAKRSVRSGRSRVFLPRPS